MKDMNLKRFVAIAMFSSIAYILMLLNFPMPGFPVFLNVDFSDIPALLAAVIYGPLAGIVVEMLKNILDYAMTGSETGVPIGHMANFIAGIAFVLPSYFIYKKFTSKRGLVAGLSVATVFMAVLMGVLNYFVILPAYATFANWGVMTSAETRAMVITAIFPFNLIKGVLVTSITLILFGKLKGWLERLSPIYQLNK
ncbi:ECF transporter S component [Bacillus testis]|uniref:ECF transporter S component n=1 Tax=Bacillus testis TaxID=1622072 RepID=UPI00067F3EEF|nr:ECF transporter S component [Bacillus testis]